MASAPDGANDRDKARRLLRAKRIQAPPASETPAPAPKKKSHVGAWTFGTIAGVLMIGAGVLWFGGGVRERPALHMASAPSQALLQPAPLASAAPMPPPQEVPLSPATLPVASEEGAASKPPAVSVNLEAIGLRVRPIDLDRRYLESAPPRGGQGLLVVNVTRADADLIRAGDIILSKCETPPSANVRRLLDHLRSQATPCLTIARDGDVRSVIAVPIESVSARPPE